MSVVVVCAVGGVGGWRAGRAGVLVEWPVAKAQVLVLSCLGLVVTVLLNFSYGAAASAVLVLVVSCLGLVVTVLLNFSYGAAASAVLVPLLLLSPAPPGVPLLSSVPPGVLKALSI
ncbi:hypothetical protein T484DRAFT_1851324 [Baffinella frigidus]|nr:hypothetical protein T484DRAFT_1851324 [Cryptophyta sp. CCMP2293]